MIVVGLWFIVASTKYIFLGEENINWGGSGPSSIKTGAISKLPWCCCLNLEGLKVNKLHIEIKLTLFYGL